MRDGKGPLHIDVPIVLKRQFMALLALRGQTLTEWMVAHMEAALAEERRHPTKNVEETGWRQESRSAR